VTNSASATSWRTSSYSQANGACVELSQTLDRVRDTKNRDGDVLAVNLSALVTEIKSGRFTR